MPCRIDDPSPNEIRQDAERKFRHNSDVAEMLCEVCKWLEVEGRTGVMNDSLLAWWAEHKARDAEKARKERREKEIDRKQKVNTIKQLEKQIALLKQQL